MRKLFFTATKLREVEAIVASGDIGTMSCADCIEDIAKVVGFSFASGDGGAE